MIELDTVICGDALEVLRGMPAESVQCYITSPPYWGLRDYGTAGQLGLEKTPEEYVTRMVEVFREVKRVLRNDGTLWLNLGDSYCGGGNYRGVNEETLTEKQKSNRASHGLSQKCGIVEIPPGLKPKDLVGIPWRMAFALQADGWYLRSDIIWSKPSPMPESVTDRPTKAHEYIFMLSKNARYYWDQEAVKEDASVGYRAVDFRPVSKKDLSDSSDYKTAATGASMNNRSQEIVSTRNIRSVWTIATQPFKGAHFATFPEALVRKCLLAGTSERGACAKCGKPWERVVERNREYDHHTYREGKTMDGPYAGQATIRNGILPVSETLGWRPTCSHYPQAEDWVEYLRYKDANNPTDEELAENSRRSVKRLMLLELYKCYEAVPCVVLDLFFGAGTVGVVAKKHNRHYVGIELNETYCEMARRRIAEVPPSLFDGAESP